MAIDDLQCAMMVQEVWEEVKSAGLLSRSKHHSHLRVSDTDRGLCVCFVNKPPGPKWRYDDNERYENIPTVCYYPDNEDRFFAQHYVMKKHVARLGLAKKPRKKKHGTGES